MMKLVIAADIPQCHQIQHRFSLNFPPHKDATEFVSRRVVKEPEFRLRVHNYTNSIRSRPNRWRWPSRPDLGERWPSRLVATAAENRCEVELQMPKESAGQFTQQALRFGFLAT